MDNGQQPTSDKFDQDPDLRLYVSHSEGWTAWIKHDSTKEYCHLQRPEDDYFHLLVIGEVYLQFGDAKYCLNCAVRQGIATADRQHWQHKRKARGTPL